MASSLPALVTSIKTGHAFGGGRFGVIAATSSAPAGSLTGLAQFLKTRSIDAVPGYGGSKDQPVLRISGFTSRHALDELLQRDYPVWSVAHGLPPVHLPTSVPVHGEPFARAEAGRRGVASVVRRSASSLSGLCYLAADASLLVSGVSHPYGRDWLKAGAALSYNAAAGVLLFFGNEGAPKSTRDLMHGLEVDLDRPTRQAWHDHLSAYVRQHPWQVAGMCDLVGLGMQTVAAARRKTSGSKVEAVALGGALAGMAMQTFVPPRGEEPIVDLGRFVPEKQNKRLAHLSAWIDRSPPLRCMMHVGRAVASHPVQMSGTLSATANLGSIYSSLSMPMVDRANLTAAGLCLAGNAAQMFVPGHEGPSLDDITTAAADLLNARHARPDEIDRAARSLLRQSGMHVSAATVRQALGERMARSAGAAPHVLRLEKGLLENSPFLPSHLGFEAARTASR